MTFRSLVFIALSLVAVLSHADPLPFKHHDPSLTYDISRSDDFSIAKSIDVTKWDRREDKATALSIDESSNATLKAGSLFLTGLNLRTPNEAGYYYEGASLTSKRRYGYGYFEMCAQTPSEGAGWTASLTASGASNALTLVSVDSSVPDEVTSRAGYVSRYNSDNGYPGVSYRYSTFDLPGKKLTTKKGDKGFKANDGFHYYGVEWTPSEIITYLDGVEVHRRVYPGPHSPVTLKFGIAADAVASGTIAKQATFKVRHVRYWTKQYDIAPPSGDVVQLTNPRTEQPENYLAFNHRVFEWNATEMSFTTKPGAVFGPLASRDPANPIHQFYLNANDLGRWTYGKKTAGAADVFVWNPSMYPSSMLQADYGATPSSIFARYMVFGDGTNAAGALEVDQLNAGQKWIGLGAYEFTTAGFVRLDAGSGWGQQKAVRAGAMYFRELNYFFDDFSGSVGAWTSTGGVWKVAENTLSQSSAGPTGISFYRRAIASSDHFVRAGVRFGALNPAKNVGLVARYQAGSASYYLLRLVAPVGGGTYSLDLARVTPRGSVTLVSIPVAASGVIAAGFSDLHLFMHGNSFQGLLNGHLLFDVKDTSDDAILAPGESGLRTYGGTAEFKKAGAGQ